MELSNRPLGENKFWGYQYLKLRASRYPSHAFGAGPSRSQRHGRRWFPILIPPKFIFPRRNGQGCGILWPRLCDGAGWFRIRPYRQWCVTP